MILIASSLPLTRKLVSCFVRVAFTTRSLSRLWMPTIMPSYTGSPALDEHAAAVVELAQRVGEDFAVVHGDQHAVLAAADLALVAMAQPSKMLLIRPGAARQGSGTRW